MGQTRAMLAAFVPGLLIAGCSSLPMPTLPGQPITTGALQDAAESGPKRGTPVVPGRPARMYVWAGFREKDCSPLTPTFVVAQAPAKGDVSFKPDQATTIRHSNSGNCLGTILAGTGIYYTARSGQIGDDAFSVTATTPDGSTATKTFNVRVVE